MGPLERILERFASHFDGERPARKPPDRLLIAFVAAMAVISLTARLSYGIAFASVMYVVFVARAIVRWRRRRLRRPR